MESKKKKRLKRPVFDSLRKPTAPPSQQIGKAKPEEKARPSLRKVKHRKDEDLEN